MKNLALGMAVVAMVVGLIGLFLGINARREFSESHSQWEELNLRVSSLGEANSRLQQDLRSLHTETANAFRDVGVRLQSIREEQAARSAREAAVVQPAVESPRAPAAPVRKSGRTHTVAEGDTLQRIANRYSIPLQALQDVNPGLDPRRIRIGQTIDLP